MVASSPVASRAVRALALGWPILFLLAAWQMWIVAGNVPAIVAPSPWAVAVELAHDPLLYVRAAASTIGVAALGLVLGMLLGLALAIAIWITPFAAGAMTVPALLVQSTPLIATLPVIARLLGYGEQTVIAAAVIITFLPTFVLAGTGCAPHRPVPTAFLPDSVLAAVRGSRCWRCRPRFRICLSRCASPRRIASLLR